MPADGFTKPLNRQQFERFRSMLDLVDLRTLEFYHSINITKTIGPTTDRDPDTERRVYGSSSTTSNATPKDLPRLGQRSQRAKVEEQAMKHY
ncbi:hypothetical protein E4U38_004565 [Claviceps purpurea]|nr:hypothetical protein E4U38_004565 [Claviceps purpurea]